jgi:hypothetical protein
MLSTVVLSLSSSVDKSLTAIQRRYVKRMHNNVMTILATVPKKMLSLKQHKLVDTLLRQDVILVNSNVQNLSA